MSDRGALTRESTRDSAERAARVGWRGFGATGVYLAIDAREREYENAWLAIGRDPESGEPCLSLWDGGAPEAGATRRIAFWMPVKSARKLHAELGRMFDQYSEQRSNTAPTPGATAPSERRQSDVEGSET